MVDEPYKICIANGMTSRDFWESTMHEICVYIEAIRNKDECRFNDLHYLASLVRVSVIAAFRPDVDVPTRADVIGGNLSKPEKTNIKTGWQESKAFMKAIQEVRARNDNR